VHDVTNLVIHFNHLPQTHANGKLI